MSQWCLCKYKHEWSIFDTISRSYILFGTKREMKKRLEQLRGGE